jgi:hypothetical protein
MDTLVCGQLANSMGSDPTIAACGVCNPPYVTTGLQLSAARQFDLTKATILAFMNGYLGCVSHDLAYLQNQLDRENDDVTVTYSGDSAKGQAHCANR